VWRILKQRVKARKEEELWQFILEEGDKITLEEINKEIDKQEAVIRQCVEHRGGMTEY
jgi:hypothetical protein